MGENDKKRVENENAFIFGFVNIFNRVFNIKCEKPLLSWLKKYSFQHFQHKNLLKTRLKTITLFIITIRKNQILQTF